MKMLVPLLMGGLAFFAFKKEDIAPNPVYGQWQAYKIIDTGEITPFPQDNLKDIEKYLASKPYQATLKAIDTLTNYINGKVFKFEEDYIIIDSTQYNNITYTISEEDPDIYLYVNHHIGNKNSLGIKDTTTKIQVIQLNLYKNQEEKDIKSPKKLYEDLVSIPVPNSSIKFYIEKLILYNSEIIIAFSILHPNRKYLNPSWQHYICLQKNTPNTIKKT